MGCRPSKTSLGRVGDSSLEYNRNFIKEQKEKKIKSKRIGKGGRRKAPVYNDFSSTSKTYTNLNSKSSRITVRLSTDGSMLEIEQFDIDLNACVDRYRAEIAPVQNHLKSQYQKSLLTSGTSLSLHRCYSAPQLNHVIQSPDVYDGDFRNNEQEQFDSKVTLSKPKKSKSVSEKGFLPKTDDWCDRKRSKGAKNEVTRNSTGASQGQRRPQFTQCESDIQVLDLEREHLNQRSETNTLESERGPNLTSALICEQNPSCSNEDMRIRFYSYDTVGTSCFDRNNSENQNHREETHTSVCIRDQSNCTMMRLSPSCSHNHLYQNSKDVVPKITSGALDTNFHERIRVDSSVCVKNKTINNSVLQYHQTDGIRTGVLKGTAESSNIDENISCETQICVTNTNILQNDCSKSLDSESMRCLLSGIDFSRRNFVLPTQLTNGFKNGDIHSSVLQPSDPKSITTHTECPSHNQNSSPLTCGHRLTADRDRREADDNFKCCDTSNLREKLVSIETIDKLMGLAEESNYVSGIAEDCVFLTQTNSSLRRANQLDSGKYIDG